MRRVRPDNNFRSVRHAARIPCQIVRERDFSLVADRLINLSASGILATPADPVLTGERVIVSFRAPGWGTWIDSEGTVKRVLHGRRDGEHSRALGIELDDLDDWSRFVLERSVAPLPPAPPGPRPGRRGCWNALRALTRLSGGVAIPAFA